MSVRILWIDDEIELLRPFIYILKNRGFSVDTASNGPDGIDMVHSKNYDLILLDEIMPGMDGIDTLRRIKNFDPDVKVIMITKSEDEPLMDEAFSNLVDGFIIKPFSSSQLIATIKRFVEQRNLLKKKLMETYGNILRYEVEPEDIDSWMDKYRELTTWKIRIHKLKDNELMTLHEERRDKLNGAFIRFFQNNYIELLKKRGELFSHNFFRRFIFPLMNQGRRVFFILIDSLRYDQFMVISRILKEFAEVRRSMSVSILPSATPFSRNAIFSGLLPYDIYRYYPEYWVWEREGQNRFEEELLRRFFEREKLKVKFKYYKVNTENHIKDVMMKLTGGKDYPFITLVVNLIDILAHNIHSTDILKNIIKDEWALLDVTGAWFSNSYIRECVEYMLSRRYTIVITSDHGFIKVKKPVVIKGSARMTLNLRYKFGNTIFVNDKDAWIVNPEHIGIPSGRESGKLAIAKGYAYFVYSTKYREYEKQYRDSYQHGGITLEEVFTPVGIVT